MKAVKAGLLWDTEKAKKLFEFSHSKSDGSGSHFIEVFKTHNGRYFITDEGKIALINSIITENVVTTLQKDYECPDDLLLKHFNVKDA